MPKHIPPGQEHNYIRRRIRGKVFYVRRGKPAKWSAAQREQRRKMERAAEYARAVMQDPERLAVYARVAKKRKAWRVFPIITADYLISPKVVAIELRGATTREPRVLIWALDDFEVVGVDVVIRDPAGAELCRGAALEVDKRWEFALTVELLKDREIMVEAMARDRPGNIGRKVECLSAAKADDLQRRRHEAQPGILARRRARKRKGG
jgi:hypothetical protein